MNNTLASMLTLVNHIIIQPLTWKFNKLGRRFFSSLAEQYLAGHSLEQGLETIIALYEDGTPHDKLSGRSSSFDILGEDAKTKDEADEYLGIYKRFIDMIVAGRESGRIRDQDAVSVSLKPTAIAAVAGDEDLPFIHPETPLVPRLEELVRYAKERNIKVTLDMEDHKWTERTLDAAQEIWKCGYDNLGIVLQSRLNRTQHDILKYITLQSYATPREKIRVRACIGVYREPRSEATNDKKEAKQRLVERIRELFAAGIYVEIATHDHDVIYQIIDEIIVPQGISPARFEFQFLRGVENAYQIDKQLLGQGYKVRYYMPVELKPEAGIPYMKRRLIQNPEMVVNAAKNIAQRAKKYASEAVERRIQRSFRHATTKYKVNRHF